MKRAAPAPILHVKRQLRPLGLPQRITCSPNRKTASPAPWRLPSLRRYSCQPSQSSPCSVGQVSSTFTPIGGLASGVKATRCLLAPWHSLATDSEKSS